MNTCSCNVLSIWVSFHKFRYAKLRIIFVLNAKKDPVRWYEIEQEIEKGTINLDSEEDLNEFIKGLQNIQENELGRSASLNLLNTFSPLSKGLSFNLVKC